MTKALFISIIFLAQTAVISGSWMIETNRTIIENIDKEKYPPKCLNVKGTYYKDKTCTEKDPTLTSLWRGVYTDNVLAALEYCVPVSQAHTKTWKEGDHDHATY